MGDFRSQEVSYDADSVAALIVAPTGRFLLQQREDRPDVDFPGLIGLFGGAVERGESTAAALSREIEEELAFLPARIDPFAVLEFDERPIGGWRCRRSYFEIVVQPDDLSAMTLREGSGMLVASVPEIPGMRIIPYDLCAILMYERRELSRLALAVHRSRKVM